MFDVLSRGFEGAMLKLRGQARLTEENLAPALREVRASLLQADVQLDVVKDFLERVKTQSLGEIVPLKDPTGQLHKVSPEDWFIKACYDELVELMSSDDIELKLEGNPAVILMVGLQGSGKTTTTGKIARMLQREGHKPLLVAADIYRPAAIDQLLVLGRKLSVPVFSIKGMKPVELAKAAVAQAKATKKDVVIIDTAGRLAVDDTLMNELEEIKAAVRPQEILFVADAMIGQDAVRTAAEFNRRVGFTGFVLTKLDGDARGGAALSVKARSPACRSSCFASSGERARPTSTKFHPDRTGAAGSSAWATCCRLIDAGLRTAISTHERGRSRGQAKIGSTVS